MPAKCSLLPWHLPGTLMDTTPCGMSSWGGSLPHLIPNDCGGKKNPSRRKVTQLGMDSPFGSFVRGVPGFHRRMGLLQIGRSSQHISHNSYLSFIRKVDQSIKKWIEHAQGTRTWTQKWHHCAWHPVGNSEVRGFGTFQQCKRTRLCLYWRLMSSSLSHPMVLGMNIHE